MKIPNTSHIPTHNQQRKVHAPLRNPSSFRISKTFPRLLFLWIHWIGKGELTLSAWTHSRGTPWCICSKIFSSLRSYLERVTYGFHERRPYMQSTNRTFYLFTVVCTCMRVYVWCVHTCIRVDSLLEARLQEGPLEVDNDIQAVLKEVWPHVACWSCPFYEARTTVFHCRSAITRTTPRMFPTGRLSSVKALVIFKFSSLYCVHSGTYTCPEAHWRRWTRLASLVTFSMRPSSSRKSPDISV